MSGNPSFCPRKHFANSLQDCVHACASARDLFAYLECVGHPALLSNGLSERAPKSIFHCQILLEVPRGDKHPKCQLTIQNHTPETTPKKVGEPFCTRSTFQPTNQRSVSFKQETEVQESQVVKSENTEPRARRPSNIAIYPAGVYL